MNRQMLVLVLVVSLLTVGLVITVLDSYSQEAGPVFIAGGESTFSYQGYLTSGSTPAEGTYDFTFTLHNSLAGDLQVGPSITLDKVNVTEGRFTVQLDFGDVFDGLPLWLEIGVSDDKDIAPYTILSPRQALGSTPYASYAYRSSWSGIAGIPAELADGDNDSLSVMSCGSGQVPKWDGTRWDCAGDDDLLSNLSCDVDKILRHSGSTWICDDDRDTDSTYSAGVGIELNGSIFNISGTYRLPQSCDPGQISEWNGLFWDCGTDDVGEGGGGGTITGVFGGNGLIGSGTAGSVTLHAGSGTGISVDADSISMGLPYRLPQSCANGEIARWNNSSGEWECATDEDRLAVLNCTAGQIAKWNGTDNIWECAADLDTVDDTVSYSEIAGIVGNTVESVAAGDHGHDDSYYTKSDFITGTAVIEWNKLISIPTGLADGDDDTLATLSCDPDEIIRQTPSGWICDVDRDTVATYQAGEGLLLQGSSFSISNSFQLPQGCVTGLIPEWNGLTWQCGEDDVGAGGGGGTITGVYGGEGLVGGGATGSVTVHAGAGVGIDLEEDAINLLLSYRLPQICSTGDIPHWNPDLGGWECDLDSDLVASLSCSEGQVVKFSEFSGWYCADDLDTNTTDDTVSFDEIISIVGTISETVAAGDHNHADNYSEINHDHDVRYYTESELQNGTGNVHWNNLFEIPGNIQDGDDDTLASLSCGEGEIAKWSGGLWGCALDEGGSGGGITGITAGEGLYGGGATGDVDLNVGPGPGISVATDDISIDLPYRLPQGCTSGQLPKWDEFFGEWFCDADFDALGNLICSPGEIPQFNGSNWICGASGSGWNLTGNSGTVYGSNFLGTTDNMSLTLAVNGAAALRLEPTTWSPNIIGGVVSNSVASGVFGATIGGGGSSIEPQRVNDHFGTIGGGTDNTVGSDNGTLDDATYGTVGGGAQNTASGKAATVGGGVGNMASNVEATIGGGYLNLASGYMSTVGGGSYNIAVQFQSTIAGGLNNSALASQSSVGGGENNRIMSTAQRATIAGGFNNTITGTYAAIGGGSGNIITGSYGTIAGGGPSNPQDYTLDTRNKVSDDYGAIGGGGFNLVGNFNADLTDAEFGTIGGGRGNAAPGIYATVGGGANNIASDGSAVAGGINNRTYDNSGTIAGGWANSVYGHYSAVGGGANNFVSATYGTIAGGNRQYVIGLAATIGGGEENWNQGDYATIGGGSDNIITGSYGTIAGGGPSNPQDYTLDTRNKVSDDYGAIGGGGFNLVGNFNADLTDAEYGTVGGGRGNAATGIYATVGGGANNIASGGSVVAGGISNRTYDNSGTIAGGWANSVYGHYSAVGGGANNIVSATYGTVAGGNENYVTGLAATIGGGKYNWNQGDYATIGGGSDNIITASYATIAGGGPSQPDNFEIDTGNRVSDNYGTIGGGGNNRVGNFNANLEDAYYATVNGGYGNAATANYATVAGGNSNSASGTSSFAAGNRANAGHDGAFVWADTLGGNVVTSDRADQFKVQAWGGSKFEDGYGLWVEMNYTALIDTSSGTYLDTAGVWHQVSDQNAKENFENLDGQQLLASLASVPINSWNYKVDDESTRHIGPVAQEFYEAFGFGNSEKTIATIDVDGVALASVQALYERSLALESENASLERQLTNLESRLAAVENSHPAGQQPLIFYIMPALFLLLLVVAGWLVIRMGLFKQSAAGVGGGS